ncbi:helix-turn-helix transcriptional regulator [Streptomyces sp. SID12501]|uniref:Helix-turn-helix domain-containing protein n=1 Tax=Streptomyces sp. SID12501 TaxID=2706042 RepID=A0A6B3BVP6_9ACTN|nr:helix-turn-helix domain-containing protein [Streptomyces sp. SID12501]
MLQQPAFGKRLRQLRQHRGISQVDLTGPGMSAAYLSRLESGNRRPTDRAVAYLAERLGVPRETFEDDRPEDSLTDLVATVAATPERDLDSDTGRLLTQGLDAAGEADPLTRWHALTQLARVYEVVGDFRKEHEALVRLNALSEELGRAALQVRARLRLARCARDLGDAKAARDAVTEVLALRDERQLRLSAAELVRSKLLLVSVQAELGDLAAAARLADEVCQSLRGTTGVLAAEAFWSAGTVAARQGNHAAATERLLEAMAAVDSHDDLKLWIRLRLVGASLSLEASPPRVEDAESFLAEAEPALKLIGTPRHQQELLYVQAKLAFHQGATDRAGELLTAGEDGRQLLSYRDQIRYDVLRGLLALRAGEQGALGRLREIAARVQAGNMPDLAAEVWRTVAENTI